MARLQACAPPKLGGYLYDDPSVSCFNAGFVDSLQRPARIFGFVFLAMPLVLGVALALPWPEPFIKRQPFTFLLEGFRAPAGRDERDFDARAFLRRLAEGKLQHLPYGWESWSLFRKGLLTAVATGFLGTRSAAAKLVVTLVILFVCAFAQATVKPFAAELQVINVLEFFALVGEGCFSLALVGRLFDGTPFFAQGSEKTLFDMIALLLNLPFLLLLAVHVADRFAWSGAHVPGAWTKWALAAKDAAERKLHTLAEEGDATPRPAAAAAASVGDRRHVARVLGGAAGRPAGSSASGATNGADGDGLGEFWFEPPLPASRRRGPPVGDDAARMRAHAGVAAYMPPPSAIPGGVRGGGGGGGGGRGGVHHHHDAAADRSISFAEARGRFEPGAGGPRSFERAASGGRALRLPGAAAGGSLAAGDVPPHESPRAAASGLRVNSADLAAFVAARSPATSVTRSSSGRGSLGGSWRSVEPSLAAAGGGRAAACRWGAAPAARVRWR